MGEHRRGYRGNFWTDDEVAQLMDMADRNCGQGEMAQVLGRTVSSVEGKLRLVRLAIERGDVHVRVVAPPFIENDERKHLAAVIAQGGFTWKVRAPA